MNIDRARLRALADVCGTGLLDQMVNAFQESIPESLARARAELAAGRSAERTFHQIKGGAAQVGAIDIAALAAAAMTADGQEQARAADQIEALLPDTLHSLTAVVRAL